MRFEILERDNFTCQYCGARGDGIVLHVDHEVSLADGGANHWRNLKTACAACNLGKGAKSRYSYKPFVDCVLRGDIYVGAPDRLVDVIVAKFKGADRAWASELVGVSDKLYHALYITEMSADWHHFVECMAEFSGERCCEELGWLVYPADRLLEWERMHNEVVDEVFARHGAVRPDWFCFGRGKAASNAN